MTLDEILEQLSKYESVLTNEPGNLSVMFLTNGSGFVQFDGSVILYFDDKEDLIQWIKDRNGIKI